MKLPKTKFSKIAILLLSLLLITAILSLILTGLFLKRTDSRRSKLELSLKMMGDWFTKNQKEHGDFVYQRLVASGEETPSNHTVRQTYSLYSLSLLLKYSGDQQIRQTFLKGTQLFKRQAKQGSFTISDKQYPTQKIEWRDSTANNSTALILLALINYLEKNPEDRGAYAAFMDGLANHLVSTQLPSGGFMYKVDPNEEDDFNNGESFFALIRYYSYTKNLLYLDAAQKAADYFLTKYPDSEFHPSFFGWGLQGYYYLYLEKPDEKYWQTIEKSVETYMQMSGNLSMDYYLHNGSTAPPNSLAVPLEGIDHAVFLAKDKNPEFFQKYKPFLDYSIDYLQQFQVNGPSSNRKSEYRQLQGGMCIDYYCQMQQIDATGHSLAALYYYLTFFND